MAVHFLSIPSPHTGRTRSQGPRRRCYRGPLVLAQYAIEVFSDQVLGNKKFLQSPMTEIDRAGHLFFKKPSQTCQATNVSAAAIATSLSP